MEAKVAAMVEADTVAQVGIEILIRSIITDAWSNLRLRASSFI